jgi:hypothetical protein
LRLEEEPRSIVGTACVDEAGLLEEVESEEMNVEKRIV